MPALQLGRVVAAVSVIFVAQIFQGNLQQLGLERPHPQRMPNGDGDGYGTDAPEDSPDRKGKSGGKGKAKDGNLGIH